MEEHNNGHIEALELPAHTTLDVSSVDTPLFISIQKWLKKHGKVVRPKLTDQQKQELQECFKLMDEDGSGAIDVDELGSAFKLLGLRLKKSEIEELVREVDHDGTGELEYPEFLEIMTDTLYRLSEEPDTPMEEGGDVRPPFALMATAYRRKKLLEGIMQGGKSALDQIVASSEEAEKEKERAARLQEAQMADASRQTSNKPNGRLKRAAQKTQMDVSLLGNALGQSELRLIAEVAIKCGMSKLTTQQAAASLSSSSGWRGGGGGKAANHVGLGHAPFGVVAAASTGPSASNTTNKSPSSPPLPPIRGAVPRYSDTASHMQLIEVPKPFCKPLTFSRTKREPAPPVAPHVPHDHGRRERDTQNQHQHPHPHPRQHGGGGSGATSQSSPSMSPPAADKDSVTEAAAAAAECGMSRSVSRASLSSSGDRDPQLHKQHSGGSGGTGGGTVSHCSSRLTLAHLDRDSHSHASGGSGGSCGRGSPSPSKGRPVLSPVDKHPPTQQPTGGVGHSQGVAASSTSLQQRQGEPQRMGFSTFTRSYSGGTTLGQVDSEG